MLATIILKFLVRAFTLLVRMCGNLCLQIRYPVRSSVFSALVLVSPAEATTGNTSAVRRLRIHHPVSPQPPRVFRIFFNTSLLNDFLPLSWSLKQAITTTAQIAGLSSAIADRSNENQA